jgi:hypothetical protein
MTCLGTTANPFDPRADFDDPIQGQAESCAFIAALSSVAWVYWPAISNSLGPALWKVNDNGDPAGQLPSCSVTKNFEMTSPGVFKNAHSSDNGIWPAVYEKVFIKKRDNCGLSPTTVLTPPGPTPPRSDDYYCDVSKDDFKRDPTGQNRWPNLWPQKTAGLVAITGWAKDHYNPNGSTNPPYGDAYANISSLCDSKFRTKFPMIAWTKTNAPLGHNEMRPVHCYSILGYLSPNYIVLRNPRATSEGSSTGGTVDLLDQPGGSTVFFAGANPFYPYKTLGNPDTSVPSRNVGSLTLNRSKGIFALSNTRFKEYFEGYGRVRAP